MLDRWLMRQIRDFYNLTLKKHYTLAEGVDKYFIYRCVYDAGLYGLESERQLVALDSMQKAILAHDKNQPITKEEVESVVQQAVRENSVAYLMQRIEAASQQIELVKQEIAAIKQDSERLRAVIAVLETGQITQTSRSQENQRLFVLTEQNAHAAATVVNVEENEVVKHASKSSTARLFTQLVAPVSPRHEDDLNSSSSINPLKKKRLISMDKETVAASPVTKKEKLGESPCTVQAYLSSIEETSNLPDDEAVREQSSAPPNPPS